jgi:hypothetical protein
MTAPPVSAKGCPETRSAMDAVGKSRTASSPHSCYDGKNVKSFGRREAYESPRGRNPRATVDGYGDFELRPMSALARLPMGSAEVDADRPLRCSIARYWRPGTGPATRLSRPCSLLKKPVMLCRCRTTLNEGATPGPCPLPQLQASSRAAGSFHGPLIEVLLVVSKLVRKKQEYCLNRYLHSCSNTERLSLR